MPGDGDGIWRWGGGRGGRWIWRYGGGLGHEYLSVCGFGVGETARVENGSEKKRAERGWAGGWGGGEAEVMGVKGEILVFRSWGDRIQ